MRQVNKAELIWNVRYALRRMRSSTKKALTSNEGFRRDQAEQLMAGEIVGALDRYEVLSDALLPEGTDLFSRAAYGDPSLPTDTSSER